MKLPAFLRQRRWLWLVGGIALVVAYLLLSGEPTPPTSPPSPVQPLAAAPAPSVTANPPSAGEPMVPPAAVDIFAVRNWEPPAPVVDATEPAPPPPPEAPPLPFRYVGRVEEPGKATVFFLLQGEQVLAVRAGDLIDGTYRVGKLQGEQLHFFYRPMKTEQFLSVGGDS